MILGILATRNLPAPLIIGFSPNWYEGQQNAGLGVFIATGMVNGVTINGHVIFVPANSTTYIWIDGSGNFQTGPVLPIISGIAPIAKIVSGQVLVGGNLPSGLNGPLGRWAGLSLTDGILSITDIRTN